MELITLILIIITWVMTCVVCYFSGKHDGRDFGYQEALSDMNELRRYPRVKHEPYSFNGKEYNRYVNDVLDPRD